MLLKFFINNFKRIIINPKKIPQFRQPYWAKIITENPRCTYYFGPFENYAEAEEMHYGYIEDLRAEQAIVVSVKIKRYLPTKLTIVKE